MLRLVFILTAFTLSKGYASSILLHTNDATVWHPEQTITGELSGLTVENVIVHHNQDSFSVKVGSNREFSFEVMLRDTENKIWVEVPGNPIIASDTLRYTLGYQPAPVIQPSVTISGDKAVLKATIIENPYDLPLQYLWVPDSLNPVSCQINDKEQAIANVDVPDAYGIYNFNLLIIAGKDSTWFQTFVERDESGIHPFDIEVAYPTWMKNAIIYQITPYNFVANGTYADIMAKLPELKSLGINTIWLQPVFKSSYRGQGYDVVDYLALNPAFGTEMALQQLITEAKALDMRVLFDLVLNHTSIQHPYAKDVIEKGENSHYYNFYQHTSEGKPYSSFLNTDKNGFMFYFWEDLVNLNYQNEEVQRWILEVCKHWVNKFDIDGYRFDAIWGVNSRMPSFARRLRMELKSIKPDILLLAEDKGSDPEVFELGFDAAYDWTADTNWVSQWTWEYEYDENMSKTIFNYPDANKRGNMMRNALFNNGGNVYKQLRYMENNDLPRFIKTHELKRTKMTAALLFSLPGIPMLYNGQEAGFEGHPYSTNAVFNRNWTIQTADRNGLFPYYQKLIKLRKQYPALSDTAMEEVFVNPDGAIVAFHRWKADENFIVVMNMDEASANADIDLSDIFPKESPIEHYWFRDVLTDKTYPVKKGAPLRIPMDGYSVRWLLLEAGEITGAANQEDKGDLVVYPNPSTGQITIDFPDLSFKDMRVIDMWGTVVFEEKISPDFQRSLNIGLPPQTYFLQVSNRKEVLTTKLLIH